MLFTRSGKGEKSCFDYKSASRKEKIRKENIIGKEKANQTHFEVGKKIRQTIKELGGTMPEDLPTPNKSIKQIEKENTRKIKKRNEGEK